MTAKTVEAILNKEDRAVDHILTQNRMLSAKIDILKESLNNVTVERNEMDEEIDSITKSKNILQSYMKNFHEMNKIETKLRNLYESEYKRYRTLYYTLIVNTLLFYMMVLFIHNPIMQLLSYTVFCSIIVSVTFHNYKSWIIKNKHINIFNEDLIMLKKNTDLVNDLMDSL